MLLSCKDRAGLVVNVTAIIPQTDKAIRVPFAVKLRVLNRLLNIDIRLGRLDWIVNCAHLTFCAVAHFRKVVAAEPWRGVKDPQIGRMTIVLSLASCAIALE